MIRILERNHDWPFITLWTANVVLAILDLNATLNVGVASYLETNPIYLLTGSFWSIIIMNFIFFILTAYAYYNQGPVARYFLTLLMYIVIPIRLLAINTANNIALNPPSVEQAKIIAENTKFQVETYANRVAFPIIISLSMMFLPFITWYYSNIKKEKEK